MKNYYNIKPETLVKLQGQFISTSFHDESEDDIQWNGDKVLPEDLLVYLGDDVVRNMRWARVFSSSHNRIGYVKLFHITEVLQ